MFVFIWCTIYTHFHEIGLKMGCNCATWLYRMQWSCLGQDFKHQTYHGTLSCCWWDTWLKTISTFAIYITLVFVTAIRSETAKKNGLDWSGMLNRTLEIQTSYQKYDFSCHCSLFSTLLTVFEENDFVLNYTVVLHQKQLINT